MRLTSLQVSNFRQFYGVSPKLIFTHGAQNIVVIHGANGSGKTALLNAFTWALFDSLSPGFQLPDQIVNKRAIREAPEGATVEAWVEVCFEHDDRKYLVKRAAQVVRTSQDPGWAARIPQPAILQWAGSDGRWRAEDRVLDIIGRVLPSDLHRYFFFDGERIERIVQQSKQEREEIGKATKKLLGVEVLHRAETHLNSVRRDLEKELSSVGDSETAQLIKTKQEAEEDIARLVERQEEIERNKDAHERRIKEIEDRLRRLEDVQSIQKRRDQLNSERAARNEAIQKARKDVANELCNSGYKVYLGEFIDTFGNMIDSLRKRGELPAGIKRQFVEQLLEKHRCICERPLDFGEESRVAVEQWMMRAGLADVEEKAIRMGGEITQIAQSVPELFSRLDGIQAKRELDRRELSRIEDELDDIAAKLKGSPREEIADLQYQLDKATEAIRELIFEQGGNETKRRGLQETVEEKEKLISRRKANEDRQALAQRRVEAASEAGKRIVAIRRLLEAEFRQGLMKKISRLFGTMSPTPYVPELGEDYSLRLLESAGGTPLPVAASQGESQILSLSFIGSIIELAKEHHAKKEGLVGPAASAYPVVMDSPFGNLDPIYRHQIAEHLPALADQIVVLVTKTQWRGEVEQAMAKRVGRVYVLTYNSPRDDLQTDTIEIGASSCDLIRRSPNAFEYTEIREIPYAC